MDNDQSMSALRRSQDTLSLSGLAVIGFTVWDVVKSFMVTAPDANPTQDSAMIDALFDKLAETNEKVLILLSLFLMGALAIDVALHLYVGISAYKEAHGKRKGWAYVVLAVLMAVGSAALMVLGLFRAPDAMMRIWLLASNVVELTAMLAYVDLIRSAVKVKRLTEAKGR